MITDAPESYDDEILLLKLVQSADARKPLVEALACARVRVDPENERGPENVVAATAPEALVERSALGTPEIVRLVVEAVLKKPVPLAVKLVDDALARVVLPVTFKVDPIPSAPVTVKAPILVEEAFEMKPAPKVCSPVQVFTSARRVEDAALIVMLADPSKETPLMVRAVASLVAAVEVPRI